MANDFSGAGDAGSSSGGSRASIDLNSDVGESFGSWRMGDDEAIMRVVSSANIACGFHGGDPVTARQTCTAAARENVAVGAHVAYRDLVGFGRRFMDVSPDELTNDVIYQIGALQAMAGASGTAVRYVKPHGALYNTIATNRQQASAVVQAIRIVDASLPILVLPGSVILEVAREAGLRAVVEAFADRAYNADGSLVSRRLPGSVIHDPAVVAQRVVRMATQSTVQTVDGDIITVDAESVCVHGDTPGAVVIAAAVRQALLEANISVESFL